MPHIAYDANRRWEYMRKYYTRVWGRKCSSDRSILPLKVKYCDDLRRLRLKSRAEDLLLKLRQEVGTDFLQNTRIVIAHIGQKNSFLSQYRRNYLPSCSFGRAPRKGEEREKCVSHAPHVSLSSANG